MIQHLKIYFHKKFSLGIGKQSSIYIIEQAKSQMHIQGANLWILLLALVICAVGLNMNSPMVLIGAMLISPLMGPIVAIGIGLSIYDMSMVWAGLKNFLVACILSVLVSAIYFSLTPVHDVTPEILLRTSPNIWDIIIAGAGGLVGAIALTRKEKGFTVIPGVAIATSLMPPLAVSAFWFLQGEWFIAMKALYLLFINSIYIIGTTFVIARILRLPKKEYPDLYQKRKILGLVYGMIIIAALPALYMTFNIITIQRTEQQFQSFTNLVTTSYPLQVLQKTINTDQKQVSLRVVGTYLSESEYISLQKMLQGSFPLLREYKLILRQGIDSDPNLGQKVVQPLLNEAIQLQTDKTLDLIQQALQEYAKQTFQPNRVLQEIQSIEKSIEMLGFSTTQTGADMMMVTITTNKILSLSKKEMIEDRLRTRIQQDKVKVLWDRVSLDRGSVVSGGIEELSE